MKLKKMVLKMMYMIVLGLQTEILVLVKIVSEKEIFLLMCTLKHTIFQLTNLTIKVHIG